MNISYKKLNSIFIRMSQLMKSNGECSLSANSLLDRFAKSFDFKSRQELKHFLNSSHEKNLEELGCVVVESYTNALNPLMTELIQDNTDPLMIIKVDLAKYMSKEYIDLLQREDYKHHILEYGSDGIHKYENYLFESHIDSFLMDSRGLFFKELTLEGLSDNSDKLDILFSYTKKHFDKVDFRVEDLDSRRMCGIEDILWQMVKMDITSKIENNFEAINKVASYYLSNNIENPDITVLENTLLHVIKEVI